jgi:hypothetical protein
MTRVAPTLLVIVQLALTLLVAGCTGGDENDRYADDADAICADVVDELPDPSGIRPGTPAADREFRELVRTRSDAIRRLRGLEPPAEDAATVAKMLRHLAKSQRLLEEAERLGESEMVAPTVIAAAKTGDGAHQAARALGLEDCARL